MHALLTGLLVVAPWWLVAQPYPIGTRETIFRDASRNRDIPVVVHYPAASAGNATPVAAGSFPVLAVGHGFVMAVGAYNNLRDHFVPKGYIVALPTTEGSFSPVHPALGQDLAFVAEALRAANSDPASPFFGAVAPASALMGHSMGGGAAILGGANNANIRAMVLLAPAETNPSAIAAAADILVPTMVIAGANDCVTPIAEHQGPMYAALTVPCRAFVNILGGGHCFFANSNFNCDFGEATCSPSPTISRARQHAVVNDFAGLWLDHFLKGDPQARIAVLDSLANSTRVLGQHTCISTRIGETAFPEWHLSPVPTNDFLIVHGAPPNTTFRVVDVAGRVVLSRRPLDGDRVDTGPLPPGAYHILLEEASGTSSRPFVVVR